MASSTRIGESVPPPSISGGSIGGSGAVESRQIHLVDNRLIMDSKMVNRLEK